MERASETATEMAISNLFRNIKWGPNVQTEDGWTESHRLERRSPRPDAFARKIRRERCVHSRRSGQK